MLRQDGGRHVAVMFIFVPTHPPTHYMASLLNTVQCFLSGEKMFLWVVTRTQAAAAAGLKSKVQLSSAKQNKRHTKENTWHCRIRTTVFLFDTFYVELRTKVDKIVIALT